MKVKVLLLVALGIMLMSSFADAARIKFNEYDESRPPAINLYDLDPSQLTIQDSGVGYVDATLTLLQDFIQLLGTRAVILTGPAGANGAGCPQDILRLSVNEPSNGAQTLLFEYKSEQAQGFGSFYIETLANYAWISIPEQFDATQDVTPYLYSYPLLVNMQNNESAPSVPEPSTFALIGLGLGGLAFLRRRK